LLTPPQQDRVENQKGKSKKTYGLRQKQFNNKNKIILTIHSNEKENNKGSKIKPK